MMKVKHWVDAHLAECYLFFMLALFPLIIHDFYFDITYTKYNFLIKVTIVFAIVTVVVREIEIGVYKSFFCAPPFLFYWLFLISGVITTLLSTYRSDSFWGKAGRYNGWFTYLIYGIAFFIVFSQKKISYRTILYYEIASVIVALLGILNYFSIDLFGFFTNLSGEAINSFTSTMGNIDVFGEYISIFVVFTGVLSVMEKESKYMRIFHEVAYMFGIVALVTNRTDSAYIGLAILLLAMPFFMSNYREVRRWMRLCIYFFVTCIGLGYTYGQIPIAKQLDGLSLLLSKKYNLLCVLLIGVLLCYIALSIIEKKRREECNINSLVKKVYVVICSGTIILFILCILVVNLFGNMQYENGIFKKMVFTDMSGSGRGLLWRIALEHYAELPFLQKIFGIGADTLRYIYEQESVQMSVLEKEYDNVHNFYLQLLVGQGIAGVTLFVVWLVSIWQKMLTQVKENPIFLATFLGTLAYFAEAAVGIHLINSSAIAMLMMSLIGVEIVRKRG